MRGRSDIKLGQRFFATLLQIFNRLKVEFLALTATTGGQPSLPFWKTQIPVALAETDSVAFRIWKGEFRWRAYDFSTASTKLDSVEEWRVYQADLALTAAILLKLEPPCVLDLVFRSDAFYRFLHCRSPFDPGLHIDRKRILFDSQCRRVSLVGVR